MKSPQEGFINQSSSFSQKPGFFAFFPFPFPHFIILLLPFGFHLPKETGLLK